MTDITERLARALEQTLAQLQAQCLINGVNQDLVLAGTQEAVDALAAYRQERPKS